MIEKSDAKLASAVRDIQDFPKPGIVFKDITPILQDARLFREAIDSLSEEWLGSKINVIAGIDARGFIFGGAMAYKMGVGFVPIRKKGKLPWETVSVEYELEYGSNTVEIHRDAVYPGQNVLLVDDLLATGGTAKAAIELLEKLGARICGVQFLLELAFLRAREHFDGYNVKSLVTVYD